MHQIVLYDKTMNVNVLHCTMTLKSFLVYFGPKVEQFILTRLSRQLYNKKKATFPKERAATIRKSKLSKIN